MIEQVLLWDVYNTEGHVTSSRDCDCNTHLSEMYSTIELVHQEMKAGRTMEPELSQKQTDTTQRWQNKHKLPTVTTKLEAVK